MAKQDANDFLVEKREVERILNDWLHSAAETWDAESGAYRFALEVELDIDGEVVGGDPVEEIRPQLPAGWEIDWTGEASGDALDVVVRRAESEYGS